MPLPEKNEKLWSMIPKDVQKDHCTGTWRMRQLLVHCIFNFLDTIRLDITPKLFQKPQNSRRQSLNESMLLVTLANSLPPAQCGYQVPMLVLNIIYKTQLLPGHMLNDI